MATATHLRVVRLEAVPSADLAAISRAALDRPLTHDGDLLVAVPSDEAIVLGSMQRLSELAAGGVAPLAPEARVIRRGSGGAEARVGPGTVWLQLALASPSALVACTPGRLLNRYVRPLLRALTKLGALAHYFDRDWISASKTPIAAVSFAHDAGTGRALVEAFIAVDAPFALRDRPSFLGKPARTLRALAIGADVDAARVADAVSDAYQGAYGVSATTRALPSDLAGTRTPGGDPRGEPPWLATRDEAIGVVAAGLDGEGRLRVGGELMASRDAIARLEDEASEAAGDAARIDSAVDALAAPGVALLGVRSLRSIRDVIHEARRAGARRAHQ